MFKGFLFRLIYFQYHIQDLKPNQLPIINVILTLLSIIEAFQFNPTATYSFQTVIPTTYP